MSDTAKKQVRKLKIIEDDPNLSAFEGDLNERVRHFKQRKKELLAPGQTLTEFASGHLYYGFHKVKGGWVYREWAPGATAMHHAALVGYAISSPSPAVIVIMPSGASSPSK